MNRMVQVATELALFKYVVAKSVLELRCVCVVKITTCHSDDESVF
jgi:hypothetical protein